MPVDYRFNPFTNTKDPLVITDERWTIPANSPFTVRLLEVPLKESPSTLAMRVYSNLLAAITSSGQLYMLVEDYSFFTVDNVCTIGTEKVQVTAISGGSAATTLSANISSTGATTCTVASATNLKVKQILQIDSEKVLVTGIAGTTITITRGYESTTATTHASGASVYVKNQLTITRGYSGTTATTHLIAADIFIELSMAEVSSSPAGGQYWPDYSTGADNDPAWNTGLVLFNMADAGKKLAVNYKGMGSLADVRAVAHGKQLFTESGVFTVPAGVQQVWVSLCGGGGNGAAGNNGVGDGGGGGGAAAKLAHEVTGLTQGTDIIVTVGAVNGVSSFGDHVSCPGGSSASGLNGGAAGGGGGANGGYSGYGGGGCLFGAGGMRGTTAGNPGSGYGSGGAGGGQDGNYAGGAGAPGMVLVEW